MIDCKDLHYAFINKANHSNSEYLHEISVAQRDIYLNEALNLVFEMLAKAPEINPKVRNDLRQLERKNVCVDCQDRGDYVVAAFPEDFYRRLRTTVKASRSGCGSRELIVRPVGSNKISEALKSPYWKPSFEYEETIGDEGEDGMYIWHNKEFEVNKVCFDYIRKMQDIACPEIDKDCPTYINQRGEVVSTNQGFEVDSTYWWRTVVDVAVLLAKRDKDDITNFQSQLNTIVFKNQIQNNNA